MKGYRLKIKRLDFISAVDAGAQGPVSNVALIKRAPGGLDITCKVTKLDQKLGLVFGWAMAGTLDGGKTPHVDLQNDAIDVSGDDFIKACAEFMEAGASSDVMHDANADGRIVFAMPLVKEVNDALGIKSDVEGLAIAMKPSPETFKRFVSGELAAFSIGGVGEREAIKRTITKEAVLTSEEAGHAHSLNLDDPAQCWLSSYSTSFQTAEGATEGHCHAWVFDTATGAITIASDSGHTHQCDMPVPADALAAYLALDAKRDAENAAVAVGIVDPPSDGIPVAGSDEESSGKVQVVVVQSRAPQSNSTRSTDPAHGEPNMKLVILSEAQHAHYSKLGSSEQEAFVTKSAAERDADVTKALAADPVIFKGEHSGIEVRKSQGDFAHKIAELAEKNASTMAKQAEEIAKRDLEIEKAAVRKEAAEVLKGMPGDDDTHDFIIASLRKGDPVKAAKALETLKGMKSTSTIGKSAPGIGGVGEPTVESAQKRWDDEVAKVAAEKKVSVAKATEMLADTQVGKQLYAEIHTAKRANA